MVGLQRVEIKRIPGRPGFWNEIQYFDVMNPPTERVGKIFRELRPGEDPEVLKGPNYDEADHEVFVAEYSHLGPIWVTDLP